jgi:hypothetical protein
MSEDGAAEVVASESVEVAPVESAPELASSEVAPEVSEAAESVEETPAVIDWNGELDSLKSAEWMSDVDEALRDRLLRGIERKFRNFERGYTTSYQENANTRRTLDARAKELNDHEVRLQRWLNGDVDPLKEKQIELDKLRVGNRAALDVLKQDHESAMQKLQNEHASKLEETVTLREELEEKLQGFERQEAQRQAEVERVQKVQEEQTIDEFEGWMKEIAPDFIENDAAFYELCALLAAGVERDRALNMLRVEYPDPRAVVAPDPEPQPEQPSAAVDLMNMGTSQSAGTTTGEPRGIDEILDTLRRQAQGGIFGQ